MTLGWGMRPFLALVLLTAVGGCRHAPEASSDTGASSFTVVEARRVPTSEKVIVGDVGEPSAARYDQDYRPAVPRKNQPLPVYPPRALKAKAGAATVGVRVQVGADGRVMDIGPSLLVFTTPGPFAEDFLEAVKATVRQWQFHPAEIFHMEHVEAPGVSYNRVDRSEKTEAQLDLAFTFTATGGVTAGK